jgi:hypothetical protein
MAETTPSIKGIRQIYNPSDEIKERIRFLYDRKRQMEDSEDRQRQMSKLDDWEKQWEGWRVDREADEWQSNHVAPITLSVVQTALSEIVKQNLRPFIMPRSSEDVDKAKVMQHVWDYAWEVSDGDKLIFDLVSELLMYGTAIFQEYYRKDIRKVGSTSMNAKTKEEKTEYKEQVDYEDVCGEIVKLQDFFVDEFARGFDGPYKARDCFRRYIMDVEDFHRMYDGSDWDQYGNAQYVKAGGDTAYYEWYKPPTGSDMSKRVEVLHYWNEPEDHFDIVANDVLIRNKPNPYKHKKLPFGRAIDVKRVHSFYGKGEPEILESIQDETNTLRRMVIDRNHLDIDKMFLVSSKLGLDDEDLMARPHGLIPTDDVNGAKAVEYGDIPRSVEMSLKHLEDDSTISTGINPRAQAMPTAGTATEAAILKESTLRRIELKVWLLKREALIRLGRLRMSNILQFYSEPKIVEIIGDKESQEYKSKVANAQQQGDLIQKDGQDYMKQYRQARIDGQELKFNDKGKLMQQKADGSTFFQLKPAYFMPYAGMFDIKYEAGSNIELSKPLMQSKILELYDRISQIALTVPNSYDPVKLGDMVIHDYFDKNPDDLKPDQQGANEGDMRMDMAIQLASMENQQMMKGIAVPATAFAPQFHTRIHLEFMNSDTFQQIPKEDPQNQIFLDHVMGELMAQEMRGQGPAVGAPTGMNQNPMATAGAMPQGGTTATRTSQGIENRPGGMKKPANKLSDIMPALQSGGNKNLP